MSCLHQPLMFNLIDQILGIIYHQPIKFHIVPVRWKPRISTFTFFQYVSAVDILIHLLKASQSDEQQCYDGH